MSNFSFFNVCVYCEHMSMWCVCVCVCVYVCVHAFGVKGHMGMGVCILRPQDMSDSPSNILLPNSMRQALSIKLGTHRYG